MHLVHGDDLDAARTKMRQHRAQEFRGDLEMPVGLEFGVAARADMMQHENGADARQDRPQQGMRAREVKRSQPGADDVVAKLLHSKIAGRFGCNCETSGKSLKKQLVGAALRGPDDGPVISSLTAPQGFVFSLFPDPRDIECTDFSGGAANGGRAQFHWSSFGHIAGWTSTAPLEADLAARSTAAIKDTVLDKTRVEVLGRDVTLAADAFSEDGRRSAVAAVEAVPGVRLVNDQTRLVPEASPFSGRPSGTSPGSPWAAVRRCRPARASCSRRPARRSAASRWSTRCNWPRGAPPRFDNAALLLVDQIAKLKDGKIAISDTKVSLSGMARDLGGREAIAAALKNLPEGFSVAANDIKAPPYVFQAYKDPVALTLTLTGYVPDNNVHAAIAAAAGAQVLQRKGGR